MSRPFPIPEVIRGINAFTRGLRSVNPEAQVRVVWVIVLVRSGQGARGGRDADRAGCRRDLMQHTDSTAVVQAAQDRGKFAVGYHSDMSKYGPKAHLTASTHNWTKYYIDTVDAVIAGNAKSGDTWSGIGDGMVELSPFGDMVPEDVRKLVDGAKDKVASGALHPFAGPVKDNTGKVRVAEGKTITDKELLTMDYFVEGVQGEVPK